MSQAENSKRQLIALLLVSAVSAATLAETPADFMNVFADQVMQEKPGFSGFSAERGKQFFQQAHVDGWSCASCHSQNPDQTGRHKVTHREIAPMAPYFNPQRFTNAHKVEKWFKRNCRDVLSRECTAQEKGDVLTYLMSVR